MFGGGYLAAETRLRLAMMRTVSVDVRLEDERGGVSDQPHRWPAWRIASEGPQPIWDWHPPANDPSFPTLSGVDPYGDTTFNHLQAPGLLAELERWREQCDPAQAEMTDEIIRLAQACRDGHHVYLRFIGG